MAREPFAGKLEKIGDYKYRIPESYMAGMHVPGIIIADAAIADTIRGEQVAQQVANVACLPGIVKCSLAMPDIHWGYGFPIGGVGATDIDEGGVISPGGVGYDINCGVRLLRSELEAKEVKARLPDLVHELSRAVPAGVGQKGRLRLKGRELEKVLTQGVRWAVKQGYGVEADIEHCEEYGCYQGANPDALSPRALERGAPQLGTLGAGNHFLEVQEVVEIFDEDIASKWGLFLGQMTLMIHSGSRGLGFQVCQDYVRDFGGAMKRHGIEVPDRQLVCAPFKSDEGQAYFGAMAAAANYAWANRQLITHWVRDQLERFFGSGWEKLGFSLVYDNSHNVAKLEEHELEGEMRSLLIHRKGATRAFAAGHAELPGDLIETGQPVLVPGSMGTSSYVVVGTEIAARETFSSSAHGAGRAMSRGEAKRRAQGRRIKDELAERGICVSARQLGTLAEEMPEAYKQIDQIVDVLTGAGLCKKIVRLKPLGVVKG